jgi:hypothetical protein
MNSRLSIALIALALFSYSATHSQTSLPFNLKVDGDENPGTGKIEKNIYINNIPAKALRDFHKHYKIDGLETWEVLKDGYLAKSTINKVKHRVFYTKSGQWKCTIKDYYGATIPSGIKNNFKGSRYEDYEITHVSEVLFPTTSALIVSLYNGRLYKIVRITQDEIELLKEYIDLNRAKDSTYQ